MTRPPRLLFLISEDWFFCSHFLDRAIAAREAGYEVMVATRVRDHASPITDAGIRLIPLELRRSGLNPLHDLGYIRQVIRIYRAERPDIVHHIAVKPILYGTLAAKCAGIRGIVNAPVGLGVVFNSNGLRNRLLRAPLTIGYRFLMNPSGSRVIIENPFHLGMFSSQGIIASERTHLIPGAGVDLNLFAPAPEPEGDVTVVLPARLLWSKGVGVFVETSRLLRERGIRCRMALVGKPDPENPTSIAPAQLTAWQADGLVECWGYRPDMHAVFRDCHIVCLPSFGEGLPKALAEAAGAGRPVVTTAIPGCRDVVTDGVNGILVPPQDATALADALERLALDPGLRRDLGANGRKVAEERFAMDKINAQTLAVYRLFNEG